MLLLLICANDVLKELKATIYFYAFIFYNDGHRQQKQFVNSPIHKHSSYNYTIKLLSFRLQIYSFYRFAFRLWVKKWLHEATKRAQVTDNPVFIYFFVLKNIKIKGAFHLDETPPCT